MGETTQKERDYLCERLKDGTTLLVDHEPLRRVLYDLNRLAAIERQVRIMARGLRAAEGLRAGSPGIDDAEVQQWQRWYDEALALSLNIDAPDAGGEDT